MSALLVLVTCKDLKEGRKIARELVERRLAACVNITEVESVYRWKGKLEECGECLLLIKTTQERFEELRKEVKTLHSYEVPEIISVRMDAGDKEYLDWVVKSTSG